MERKKTNTKDLAIFVCILLVAIVFDLIIYSFAFYYNTSTSTGTITLGEVDFSVVEENKQEILAFPNISISKIVSIGNYKNNDKTNYKNLVDIFFKYQMQIYVDGQFDEDLTKLVTLNSDNFYRDENTYYFCDVLEAGEQVDLFQSISFSDKIGNDYQDKQIQLKLNIDAIQSKFDAYKEAWQDYPTQWEEIIKKLN